MCLACGGKPETVGRSPDIKQFVKNDKVGQHSFAEVDLVENDSGKVVTVRRTINSKNKTSQYV